MSFPILYLLSLYVCLYALVVVLLKFICVLVNGFVYVCAACVGVCVSTNIMLIRKHSRKEAFNFVHLLQQHEQITLTFQLTHSFTHLLYYNPIIVKEIFLE